MQLRAAAQHIAEVDAFVEFTRVSKLESGGGMQQFVAPPKCDRARKSVRAALKGLLCYGSRERALAVVCAA